MKIAYEPHPVSAERKRELLAAGFKILDVRFKPTDSVDVILASENMLVENTQLDLPKSAPAFAHRRGRKPKGDAE